MGRDFMLSTETAKQLYHDFAETMPIIDYHCHLNPREIYEDRRFENITQLWLGGDHYKWRLMRSMGVEEQYITGDASDYEKFQKWAWALSLAIGNPLYHWSHMELRNYFGYEGILNGSTADAVWQLCNEKLAQTDFSARELIRRTKVKALCTTDDPADSLKWHKRLAADDFEVGVFPAFRPDRAVNIETEDYLNYLIVLGNAAGKDIHCYVDLVSALKSRIAYFHSVGCRISDHGLKAVPYFPAEDGEIERIFQKRLSGQRLSETDVKKFKTALLLVLGREYNHRGWIMQLHYGVIRDNSKRIFRLLGADAGIDAIGSQASMDELIGFMNGLDETGELPKTILYSLNPNDNAAIGTVIGCFQTSEAFGKIQHGSAWWFNDHQKGMEDQLINLAAEGALATFVGMLTDSRSFLSYARHEYFRRILCRLLGNWVEEGLFPKDMEVLGALVRDISYNNAARYFSLEGKSL